MAAAKVALRRVVDEHAHVSSSDDVLNAEDSPPLPNTPIHSWDCARVEAWLAAREGVPREVVAAVRAAGLDGGAILELGAKGWEELGLSSRVAQAKLISGIKKVGTGGEATRRLSAVVVGKAGEARKAGRQETQMLIDKRTPQGGAEHTKWWLAAVANSTADTARTKEHILRFLGMYNVVDLLVLTISITVVFSADAAARWWELVIHCLLVVSSYQTGIALAASTVLYNTTSCVSERNIPLFAKQPATMNQIQLVNDYSMNGLNLTIITIALKALQLGVGETFPGEVDVSEAGLGLAKASPEYLAFFSLRLALVFVLPFCFFFYRHFGKYIGRRSDTQSVLFNISMTTHCAMYGGLMGDREVLPPGEEPGWAIRASVEECEAFCCGEITRHIEKPLGFQDDMLALYASQSTAEMRPDPQAHVSTLNPLLGDAVAALLALGKGANGTAGAKSGMSWGLG